MSHPSIALPPELVGHEILASVSGGKDSTALMLALREAGIPFRAVFADTGWEHPDVYRYLDMLRERLGPIDVVGAEGGMAAKVRARAGFPARVQRWCTRELKIAPIMKYAAAVEAETGKVTANAVGVRADESAKRAKMGELERQAEGARGWGSWVWRPLIAWSIDDVLRIHLAHGVPVNPLYQRGHDRVGCWPCIHSSKAEIKLLAEQDPGRIDTIRALEAEASAIRAERNGAEPFEWQPCPCTKPRKTGGYYIDEEGEEREAIEDDAAVSARTASCTECVGRGEVWRRRVRYAWESATFFQGRQNSPLGVAPGIDDVVSWAKTSRGGRQLPLIDDGPRGGCMLWGLCDTGGREAPR